MTRQRKILVIIAGVIAVVILSFLGYLALANPTWSPVPALKGDGQGTSTIEKKNQDIAATVKAKQVQADTQLSTALSFVPANAIVVSHANLSAVDGGSEWWINYKKLLPPSYLLPDALSDSLKVTSLTYADFPTPGVVTTSISPFSQEIVITSAIEDGDALRDYVASNKDSNTFVHYTTLDKTAYIVISNVPSYNTIADLVAGKETVKTFDSLQQSKDFTVDTEYPTMYINMSAYIDTLSSYQPSKTDFTNSLLSEGIGMSKDTQWLGTSKDQGASWQGKFLSGKIDSSKIDPEKFSGIINSELTFITQSTTESDGGVFEEGTVSYGLGSVGDAISVAKGEKTSGSVLNPHNFGQDGTVAKSGNNDVVIVFSPQMFQSAYQGSIEPYSVHTITLTINKNKADLTFDFYEDSDFAQTIPAVDPTSTP